MKKGIVFGLIVLMLMSLSGCIRNNPIVPDGNNDSDDELIKWPDFSFEKEVNPYEIDSPIKSPVDSSVDIDKIPEEEKPIDLKEEYLALYNRYCEEAKQFTNYTLTNKQNMTMYIFGMSIPSQSEDVYFVDMNSSSALIRSISDDFRSEGIIRTLDGNYVLEEVLDKKLYRTYLGEENEMTFSEILEEFGVQPLYEMLASDGTPEGEIKKINDNKYEFFLDFSQNQYMNYWELYTEMGLSEDVIKNLKLKITVEINFETKEIIQIMQMSKITIDSSLGISMAMTSELRINHAGSTIVPRIDESIYPTPNLPSSIELANESIEIGEGYTFTDQNVMDDYEYYAQVKLEKGFYGLATDFSSMKAQLMDSNYETVEPLKTKGYMGLYDVNKGTYYLKIYNQDTSANKYNVTLQMVEGFNSSSMEDPQSIDSDIILHHAADCVYVSLISNQTGFLKITARFDNPNHSANFVYPSFSNSMIHHEMGATYLYVDKGEEVILGIEPRPDNGYFTQTVLKLNTEVISVTKEETEMTSEFPKTWTLTGPQMENSMFRLNITEEGIYNIQNQTLAVQYYPGPTIKVYKTDGSLVSSIGNDRWNLGVGEYKVEVKSLPSLDAFRFKIVMVSAPINQNKEYSIEMTSTPQTLILEALPLGATSKFSFELTEEATLALKVATQARKYFYLQELDGYEKFGSLQEDGTITFQIPAGMYYILVVHGSSLPVNTEFQVYLSNED